MSDIVVDDHANESELLVELGGAAAWYALCGEMYCRRREETRRAEGMPLGFIPGAAALSLFAEPSAAEFVKAFVRVKLWAEVDGGFMLPYYDRKYAHRPASASNGASKDQQRLLTQGQLDARRAGGRARAATSNRVAGRFQQPPARTSNGPPAAGPATDQQRHQQNTSSGDPSDQVGSGSASEAENPKDSVVVAKDLTGGRDGAPPPPPRAEDDQQKSLLERLQQPVSPAGEAPAARRDPLDERMPWSRWFPSREMLEYCKRVGLTDRDVDATFAEARDALTGRHDFHWFDVKVWRFLDVAIQRKARPPGLRSHQRLNGALRGGYEPDAPVCAPSPLADKNRRDREETERKLAELEGVNE